VKVGEGEEGGGVMRNSGSHDERGKDGDSERKGPRTEWASPFYLGDPVRERV
jgi:hypothetical protein